MDGGKFPLPDQPRFAAPMQLDECRALWCAVLAEVWRQAFFRRFDEAPNDVADARRWFGTRDFHQVCMLAGLDSDHILRGYHDVLAGRRPAIHLRGADCYRGSRAAA